MKNVEFHLYLYYEKTYDVIDTRFIDKYRTVYYLL